jgi:hypothetical protein
MVMHTTVLAHTANGAVNASRARLVTTSASEDGKTALPHRRARWLCTTLVVRAHDQGGEHGHCPRLGA